MECWLCLAGGNALGAFHAGAWTAIETSSLNVTRIAGASIGAVVAAIIAGNAPADRAGMLTEFLQRIAQPSPVLGGRRLLVTATLMAGNPALFSPSFPGLLEVLPFMPPDVALFRRDRMRQLLEQSIDFDILNGGGMEVTLTALDAETGAITRFRTGEQTLTVDHVMASTALPGLFPPVTIAGRTFLDPGLCENLPLPSLLDREGDAAVIALDLYPLAGRMTSTVNGIADRAQALAFAGQSTRIIELARATERRFLHLVLDDPADDYALKAFDYSRASLDRRRQLGKDLTDAHLREWLKGQGNASA